MSENSTPKYSFVFRPYFYSLVFLRLFVLLSSCELSRLVRPCRASHADYLPSLVLPDSPAKARFLNHDEKVIALERLRANNQVRSMFCYTEYRSVFLLTQPIIFRELSLKSGNGNRSGTSVRTRRRIFGLPFYSFARKFRVL